MSRYRGSRNKIARRFGINLWGRPKNPLEVKKSPPGKAPGRRIMKKSDYGVQLEEKQKLRYYYGGISEKQFKKHFRHAQKLKGDTGEVFLSLLERRLDVVVYRMNFAPTIFAARQLVAHSHFRINNKKVNIPSYLVKEGDTITLKEKSQKIPMILGHLDNPERELPEYVTLEKEKFTGTFDHIPKIDEIEYPFPLNQMLVVEYYSK